MEKKKLPKVVGAFAQLRLTGNITPPSWFKTITFRTKRGTYPDLLAINLLADLVYWHRPKEVRNEQTGQLIALDKKFKGAKLQRNPKQIASMFGCSEAQARGAIDHLEARHLVKKDYEHSKSGRKNWQMFLTPLPDVVRLYSHCEPESTCRFDFIEKKDRAFIWSPGTQDCELANLFKPQDCELATGTQDCELATGKIANSQPSIRTETTITETTIFSSTKKKQQAKAPSAKKKKKEPVSQAEEKLDKKKNIGAFVDVRQVFLTQIHGEYIPKDLKLEWTAKELGSLKNLSTALQRKASAANYNYSDFAEDVLTPFLERYLNLNTWYSNEFTPSHIYSHFNRIYDDIKGNKKNNSSDGKPNYTTTRKAQAKAFGNAVKEAFRQMQ